nr:MAG TPA: hypothetical protein [Caudoviricetes sp.]DAY72469.1 MAG TPA: hypothetical protein [Caudoviricetes sp.]
MYILMQKIRPFGLLVNGIKQRSIHSLTVTI